MNEHGKKLSKRRDPVAVELYREQGYLPAAFRNYLALLGWSPGDEEIVPIETMVERFRLEDVQKSPAFFDVKKLTHFNGVYIRALSVPEFIETARPWVDPVAGEWAPGGWLDPDNDAPVVAPVPWPPSRYDEVAFAEVACVTQERVAVLSEVPALVDFLFGAGRADRRGQLGRRRSPVTRRRRRSWARRWRPTPSACGTRTRLHAVTLEDSRRPRGASSARRRRRSGWP